MSAKKTNCEDVNNGKWEGLIDVLFCDCELAWEK